MRWVTDFCRLIIGKDSRGRIVPYTASRVGDDAAALSAKLSMQGQY